MDEKKLVISMPLCCARVSFELHCEPRLDSTYQRECIRPIEATGVVGFSVKCECSSTHCLLTFDFRLLSVSRSVGRRTVCRQSSRKWSVQSTRRQRRWPELSENTYISVCKSTNSTAAHGKFHRMQRKM